MPLKCKGLVRVKENAKTLWRIKDDKLTGDYNRAIGIAFKFVKIEGGMEAKNGNRVR